MAFLVNATTAIDNTPSVVTSGGNVGIGTTSPSSKLHVSNAAAATRITITDDVTNGRSGYIESNYSDALVIGTTSGVRSIRFAPDNTTRMTIDVGTGNVGIGTTSPVSRLDVATNVTDSSSPLLLQNLASASYGKLQVGIAGGAGAYSSASVLGDVVIRNTTASRAVIIGGGGGVHLGAGGTDNDSRLFVNSSGNVGIGTTSPLHKFHITQAVDGNYPTLGTGKGALFIAGDTNLYGMYLGVNTSSGDGFIQTMRNNSATAYNLILNSAGGSVGIGTTSISGGSERLSVVGGNNLVGRFKGTSGGLAAIDVVNSVDKLIQMGLYASGYGGGSNFSVGANGSYIIAGTGAPMGIGTNDAQPLLLATNGSEKVRILSDGNVGIGTTSAGSKLTVSGSNSGSVPLLDLIASGTGTFQRGVRLINSGMNSGDHIMYAAGRADNSKNMGQFYFYYAGDASNSNRISMGLHSVDDVFNILASGNVGIATTSPSEKLHVIGKILASDNITAYSDIRIKKNVRTIENALEKVQELRGVSYERIDNGSQGIGVIAQEVKEIIPEVVSGSEETQYSVAYGNMVGLLIEAIKEQQTQIQELKATLDKITNK